MLRGEIKSTCQLKVVTTLVHSQRSSAGGMPCGASGQFMQVLRGRSFGEVSKLEDHLPGPPSWRWASSEDSYSRCKGACADWFLVHGGRPKLTPEPAENGTAAGL